MTPADPAQPNLYRTTAHLYDLSYSESEDPGNDIPFYLECASRTTGAILELACGTGRLALPLAAAGHRVWGVDLSEPMLVVCREKLSGAGSEIRQRVHLRLDDVSDMQLDRQFELVIMAYRSFQLLLTRPRAMACLKSAHHHLASNGLFIVDVYRPYENLSEDWVSPEIHDWEHVDQRTGTVISKSHARKKIDLAEQIIHAEVYYQVTRPDGDVSQLVEPLVLKYYYQSQMESMLAEAGFRVVDRYGDYDKRPIGQGREQIFVCAPQ